MSEPQLDEVRRRMREDWNQRAAEDAHYYVAFGRRNQTDDEFFDTAREQVIGLEREIRRLGPGRPRARRALEIGCGPGRLLKPLSARFGEIHGIDVSDGMVERARRNLAGIPHAHAHHAPNSDLSAFADDSFDFVYSYAVFQHIPSRELVLGYLDEAQRVLKPGGLLRCQINGLPATAKTYDTWSGVRIAPEEVRQFSQAKAMQLLALEGTGTQYMWVTLRKPDTAPSPAAPLPAIRIHRVTNANSSEPAVPLRGRFAAAGIWVEGLPGWADLLSLEVTIDGTPAFLSYLAHPEPDGLQQLNLHLPPDLGSGLKPLVLSLAGQPVAQFAIRLVPPGPVVPRLVALSDGIDLLSGTRLVTRTIKVTLEEVWRPEQVRVAIGWRGVPAPQPGLDLEHFCIDPRVPTHEINCRLPGGVPPGPAEVLVTAGQRLLGRVPVEVVATAG